MQLKAFPWQKSRELFITIYTNQLISKLGIRKNFNSVTERGENILPYVSTVCRNMVNTTFACKCSVTYIFTFN